MTGPEEEAVAAGFAALNRMLDRWKAYRLPTHCPHCHVPLMGGATRHKKDCPIYQLIEEEFPGFQDKHP